MRLFTALSFGAVLAACSVATAAPFTADFETNQAANFTTVIGSSTNDANANFVYNSTAFVQNNTSGTVTDIQPAPGASTENVLRLNANVNEAGDVADTDSVVVYPNVATPIGTSWAMQADIWQNYNGGATGGNGSTMYFMIGATGAKTVAPKIGSPAGTGFFFSMTAEGGATVDYRFYSGAGTIALNNGVASWMGGAANANVGNGDAAWTAFFTQPAFETLGAAGKAWVTFRLVADGTTAKLYAKRIGDSAFTEVASATIPAGATNPFIGYSDLNTGQPTLITWIRDQFVLVDNVWLDNVTAGVPDWSIY